MPLSRGANERLWDAVIKEALIESMNRELDETEQNIEPHNFSSQFEHKMNRLIKSIGRKEKAQTVGKVIGKFAVTAATVMGILFGGFLTQQEVYAAVGNVIRSIFSTHDKYTYSTAKKAYNNLNACMELGVQRGEILKNSVKGVKLPSSKVKERKEITAYTPEEFATIVEEAKRTYKNGTPVYRYGYL